MYVSAYVTRDQLVECLPVTVASGGDQVGHVLWHRAFRPRPRVRLRDDRARARRCYRVSLCTVWVRSQRQYFFISMRSRSFTLFLVVM